MVLMNYIELQPGIPTRLHFTDDYRIDRRIAVPETGGTKRVNSLVFQVDELEGEPVSRTLSVLSQKLAAQLEPFIEGQRYLDYDFIITRSGSGFLTDWNVQTIRRASP